MARIIDSYIEYDEETGILIWVKSPKYDVLVGDRVGTVDHKGYRRFKLLGTNWSAHRFIWLSVYGYLPEQIDHINGNRDDNRLCNLREATATQNAQNKSVQKNSSTGVKGVTLRPNGKFRARCINNGVRQSLGDYDSMEDAKLALSVFRKLVHGEFANDGRW